MGLIKNFLQTTKEKAEDTLDETKEKVSKVAESADKFISDGNNQMKVITITAIVIGISIFVANTVSIITNIAGMRSHKDGKVVTNIFIYREDLNAKIK